MFQDENNIYEIAYMMCNESIKKMLGDDLNVVIDKAVDDTVKMFSPKVKDCDTLKKYLHSRISREREEDEPSVTLLKSSLSTIASWVFSTTIQSFSSVACLASLSYRLVRLFPCTMFPI